MTRTACTLRDGRTTRLAEPTSSRDGADRARRIEEHLGLATRLARRFRGRGESIEDLEQVAALALVHAADRFDPAQDVSFPAYATATILGELKRHFRDKGWAVRPPRRIQELCLELNKVVEERAQELRRPPTIDELAAGCGAQVEDVIEALDAASSYWTASLDAPTADGDSVGDHVGGEDETLDRVDRRSLLSPHLEALSARDRRILLLRFEVGLTQSEIAERMGLSQMHVSRLLRSSLGALRASFGELGHEDVADLIE